MIDYIKFGFRNQPYRKYKIMFRSIDRVLKGKYVNRISDGTLGLAPTKS